MSSVENWFFLSCSNKKVEISLRSMQSAVLCSSSTFPLQQFWDFQMIKFSLRILRFNRQREEKEENLNMIQIDFLAVVIYRLSRLLLCRNSLVFWWNVENVDDRGGWEFLRFCRCFVLPFLSRVFFLFFCWTEESRAALILWHTSRERYSRVPVPRHDVCSFISDFGCCHVN